jgi:ubiquinone/menaquinone biosynthesis C-methylase UbiE
MRLMDRQHQQIAQNIELHEKIAKQYDNRHTEIYNDVEQQRLRLALQEAIREIKTGTDIVYAMDYGCGSGNLTRHLLALGCRVMTADVTPSFVEMASSISPLNTVPHILNGQDLREIPSDTFDFVATYSVLHHVPDYLQAVRELARVVKPGGILFLDHERSESFWESTPKLKELYELTKIRRSPWWYLSRFFIPKWWVKRIRKTLNPRYQEEGDIHVWHDDHIEWPLIRQILDEAGFEIVRDEAYLLYETHYPLDVFTSFSEMCDDIRLIVSRKRQ